MTLKLDATRLDRAGGVALMGILNITPDSFSDGGRFNTYETALAQAWRLQTEGADILDIGGESTRPGSDAVPIDEELHRVMPVIEALIAAGYPLPISVDTTKAEVARAACAAGARIVNDISGGVFEPEIMRVAAEHGATFVITHTAGPPKTMQQTYAYSDVVGEVETFFCERLAAAEAMGLGREDLILDPGIGFGKSAAHNLSLIRASGRYAKLGAPILIGASRKRFIGELCGGATTAERLEGSLAAAALAVTAGARLLRVHDVGATRRFLSVFMAESPDA